MPELQWLGVQPEQKSEQSYLAEALGGVGKGYLAGKVKRKESDREYKLEYDKLDYKKKKDTLDLITRMLPNLPPDKQQEFLSRPEVTALYESAGVPKPSSLQANQGKVAKVMTWISTKKKPSPMTGLAIPMTNREDMDTAISLELSDADWRNSYPSIAAAFEASYPITEKEEKTSWFGRKSTGGYGKLSEQELFNKASAGDQEAIKEAVRRGYKLGR